MADARGVTARDVIVELYAHYANQEHDRKVREREARAASEAGRESEVESVDLLDLSED